MHGPPPPYQSPPSNGGTLHSDHGWWLADKVSHLGWVLGMVAQKVEAIDQRTHLIAERQAVVLNTMASLEHRADQPRPPPAPPSPSSTSSPPPAPKPGWTLPPVSPWHVAWLITLGVLAAIGHLDPATAKKLFLQALGLSPG